MTTRDLRNHLNNQTVPNASAVFGASEQPLFNAPMPRKQQQIIQQLPDDAIISREDGTLAIGRFIMSGIGLQVPDAIEPDEWIPLFTALFKVRDHISLWLADALAAYDRMPYGSVNDVAAYFGYEVASIWNLKSLGSSVEYSRRREVSEQVMAIMPDAKLLTISHINAIQAFDTDLQDKLMWKIMVKGWSVAYLRKIVRKLNGISNSLTFDKYLNQITGLSKVRRRIKLNADQRLMLISFHQHEIEKLRDDST